MGRNFSLVRKVRGVAPDAPPNQLESRVAATAPPGGDRRRSRYNLGLSRSIPEVPSLWWVAGTATLSLVAVASVALLIQLLVFHLATLGSVLAPGSAAGLLVFHITNGFRNRRKATARRLHAINELNHHIRNGLQQIAAVTTLNEGEEYEQIQSAIDRIERILRDCSTEIRGDD